MGKYDFDRGIDRKGTGAMKYDALTELFGRADITPLWIADMEFAAAPEIQKALVDRFNHPVYGYASTPESYWNSIQNWLQKRHNFSVSREELTFVPGVVRAIAYAVNFFTTKGDKVVIQTPVYHPFRIVTEGNGRTVVENPLIPSNDSTGYKMDLEGLEKIFATERPKLMILCNPHNPIGIQWSKETLAQVGKLARKYGVIVVSDEIHGDLMLYKRRHIPFIEAGEDAAAVGIAFGAPSKTFNIPGLVSSWAVVRNPELRKPFYNWMEVNEFSAPNFTAMVGTEAAYTHGEPWLDELLEYIQGNIEAVESFFADNCPDIKVIRPEASFLIWLDCRNLGMSQKELVDFFVNDARLALNSGTMFGSQGEGFMRLNIAQPRAGLLKSLSSVVKALAARTVNA
ncbi:MAG: PatB family C-S lyase [Paramuribaculum sp.]|nr:PatB family C-S lyase [Paramuribaculum sp.]